MFIHLFQSLILLYSYIHSFQNFKEQFLEFIHLALNGLLNPTLNSEVPIEDFEQKRVWKLVSSDFWQL
jgi:hypothetical protein